MYFFEGEFQKPPQDPSFHLHIHLIPRPTSFDTPERLRVTRNGVTWVDGWLAPGLVGRGAVPESYDLGRLGREDRIDQLMIYLRRKSTTLS